MVNITYLLVGSNGDTIVFDNSEYILNTGIAGFGIPATEVRIAPSASDGGIWRYTKRGIRDVDLPITVLGTDRNDVQTKLRRLARLTQDKKGPTQLRANYSNGESVRLELHYTGGAESQWGEDEGMTWATWVMSFQAPMPFWESNDGQSFSLTSGATGRGLLPQLTKLRVSSSNALGTVTVNSDADVDVFPVWTITGPISEFAATNGTLSWGFNAPVDEGETITVDTEAGTVKDQDGNNRYALLAPAPKLFAFAPGQTVISVTGSSTSDDTIVRCDYSLRFEVVH
jgi:hypothetical protein